DRSPWARASAIALITAGRSMVFSLCNSACKRSAPRAVRGMADMSFPKTKVENAPNGSVSVKKYIQPCVHATEAGQVSDANKKIEQAGTAPGRLLIRDPGDSPWSNHAHDETWRRPKQNTGSGCEAGLSSQN